MDQQSTTVLEAPLIPADAAGFSPAGLAAIETELTADVAAGKIPGAVVLVERRGQAVQRAAIGYRDKPADTPMTLDTIFRIYSMTKPITSVALMMLVEAGKLRIEDPVAEYLPEFGAPTVGLDRVPCAPAMTIKHLLTHTAGLTYGVFDFSPVGPLYREAGVQRREITLAEMVTRLGRLPLSTPPGTQWEYSMATDVLGRVIEVIAEMPFDQFLAQRIFDPLGMSETGFHVPPAAHRRIAEPLSERLNDVRKPAASLSGGGGLVSTPSDYLRFARALLGGGRHRGVRLLAEDTLAEMTRDHIGPLAGTGPHYIPRRGYGFGLGFAVRTAKDGFAPGAIGDYCWSGYGGTYFWIDPANDMIVIFLAQTPEHREHYRVRLRELVYGAMID